MRLFSFITLRGVLVLGTFLFIALFALWLGTAPPITVGVSAPKSDTRYIAIEGLQRGDTVPQQFQLIGEAHSEWFVESSIPVEIRDPKGNVLWLGLAETEEDYTILEIVTFKIRVDVKEYMGPADIVVMRFNASGDPAEDLQYTVPITIVSDTQQ